jgi:hypothetical protein
MPAHRPARDVALVKSVGGQPIHRCPNLTILYRQANLFNAVAFRRDGLTRGAVRLMHISMGFSMGFNSSGIAGLSLTRQNGGFCRMMDR